MNDLNKKRLALLTETVEHYDIYNRSFRDDSCFYAPGGGSEGCAIGRKIEDKELCALLDSYLKIDGKDASVHTNFDMLPDDLKQYGASFLINLQGLHDKASNWNESGISENGSEAVKRIIDNIESGHYDN